MELARRRRSAFAQLQRMAFEHARRQNEEVANKPAANVDNPLALLKDANQLEGIVKSFGLSEPDKEGRVFSVTIDREFGPEQLAYYSGHTVSGSRIRRHDRGRRPRHDGARHLCIEGGQHG